MLHFACPHCGSVLSAPDECAGQISKCQCGTQLIIPKAPASADAMQAGTAAAVQVTCPGCHSPLMVSPDKLSQLIQCPSCHGVFTGMLVASADAPQPAAAPPPPQPVAASPPPMPGPAPPPPPALRRPKTAPRLSFLMHMETVPTPSRRRRRRGLGCAIVVLFFLVSLSALGIAAWLFLFPHQSPLAPFTFVIPHDTVLVVNLDLAAQEKTSVITAEAHEFRQALCGSLKDLHLEPNTSGPMSLFAAVTSKGEMVRVWTFREPVNIDRSSKGRYEEIKKGDARFLKDRFEPETFWCVDNKGRLLSGPLGLLEDAMRRAKANKKAAAYDDLNRWVGEVPANALLWGIADLGRLDLKATPLPAEQVEALKGTRTDGLFFCLKTTEDRELVLQAKLFCPSKGDAQACRQVLEEMKEQVENLLGVDLAREQAETLAQALAESQLQDEDNKLLMDLSLPPSLARLGLEARTKELLQAQETVKEKIKKAYIENMQKAEAAFAKEQFEEANAAYGQALDLFPNSQQAKDKLRAVRAAWDRKKVFDQHLADFDQSITEADQALNSKGLDLTTEKLDLARDRLDQAKDKLTAAKGQLNKAQALRPLDPLLASRAKKWRGLDEEWDFQNAFQKGNVALADQKLDEAKKHFQAAGRFRPKDSRVLASLEALKKVQQVKSLLAEAAESKAPQAAGQALKKAHDLLVSNLKNDGRLAPVVDELANDAALAFSELSESCRSSARDLKIKGRLAVAEEKYRDAAQAYAEGLEQLKKAKGFLENAVSLSASKQTERAMHKIEMELKALDLEWQRVQGQVCLAEVRALFNQGQQDLKDRQADSRKLLAARNEFQQAAAKLEEAKKYPGAAADPLFTNVPKALDKVARLIQPIDFHPAKAKWPDGKDGWQVYENKDRTFLKVAARDSGTLIFPGIEFPADFQLVLDCDLVDKWGKPFGVKRWSFSPDLVMVELRGKDPAGNLKISLGRYRFPSSVYYDGVLTIQTGKEESKNEPKKLVFQGQFDNDFRHRLRLQVMRRGDKVIISLEGARPISDSLRLRSDFQKLVITVRNGVRTIPQRETEVYPILYGVTLRLSEAQRPPASGRR
jgi:hypothetical protein